MNELVIRIKNIQGQVKDQQKVADMIEDYLDKQGIHVDVEVGRQGMYGWIEGSPSQKKKV